MNVKQAGNAVAQLGGGCDAFTPVCGGGFVTCGVTSPMHWVRAGGRRPSVEAWSVRVGSYLMHTRVK